MIRFYRFTWLPQRRSARDNIPMALDPPAPPPGLSPEDYYFEGPYLVFTAAYHRKRGTCCGSGCRHCPYKEKEKEAGAQLPPPPRD